MTSVIGLDIGNLQSKIGLARNRGIDIIVNETSNRATPSLVSFGPRSRTMGESAKTQETSNYRNTIGSLKRLIGRTFNDADVQTKEKKFINAQLIDMNGTVGIEVDYLGERHAFTATQLYAMYLGKLRDIAKNESKAAVNDVVIAVPGWYTNIQRQAVLDAAEIAGLNALRLINDGTATALGYGITKTDLPETSEKARHVAFIDIGHSDYSVTIAAYSKAQLVIKAAAYDRHFGGRDLDFALVEYFAEEFKVKYKIDVMSNKKAIFRLYTAVEKLKKVLSANISAPLNVESIMDDIDAASSLTREKLEDLISPLLERTSGPLEQALRDSGLNKEDIDAIELIGGTTRMPALKTRIQDFFGRPTSVTTNQDEAVARGATLACATLSPIFRVREFAFTDIQQYPIDIVWEKVEEDPDTQLCLFAKANAVPSTKILTLQRREAFKLEARYADSSSLPGTIDPWIGSVTVKGVVALKEDQPATVKVKTRINPNGVFSFDGATLYQQADPKEATELSAGADDGGSKRPASRIELNTVVGTPALERSHLETLREQEGQMHATDRLVAETEDRKNALEEYIYDARDKVDGSYSSYMQSEDKEKLKGLLTAAEDWLYSEEGEDATKSAYMEKLEQLKVIGAPAAFRYKENEERPAAVKRLRETLSKYYAKATGNEARYAHIQDSDKQAVVEKVATVEKWLNDETARQAERPKSSNACFTSADALKKREEVSLFATPIFNKKAPFVNKSPETEATPSEPKPEADQAEAAVHEAESQIPATVPEEGVGMDVD